MTGQNIHVLRMTSPREEGASGAGGASSTVLMASGQGGLLLQATGGGWAAAGAAWRLGLSAPLRAAAQYPFLSLKCLQAGVDRKGALQQKHHACGNSGPGTAVSDFTWCCYSI